MTARSIAGSLKRQFGQFLYKHTFHGGDDIRLEMCGREALLGYFKLRDHAKVGKRPRVPGLIPVWVQLRRYSVIAEYLLRFALLEGQRPLYKTRLLDKHRGLTLSIPPAIVQAPHDIALAAW